MINFTKIKYYRQKIRILLMERPKLRPLQREIDYILSNSGNRHNRCVFLQLKMKEQVYRLTKVIESISKDIGRLK